MLAGTLDLEKGISHIVGWLSDIAERDRSGHLEVWWLSEDWSEDGKCKRSNAMCSRVQCGVVVRASRKIHRAVKQQSNKVTAQRRQFREKGRLHPIGHNARQGTFWPDSLQQHSKTPNLISPSSTHPSTDQKTHKEEERRTVVSFERYLLFSCFMLHHSTIASTVVVMLMVLR
jgi:hypothetical protein